MLAAFDLERVYCVDKKHTEKRNWENLSESPGRLRSYKQVFVRDLRIDDVVCGPCSEAHIDEDLESISSGTPGPNCEKLQKTEPNDSADDLEQEIQRQDQAHN